MNISAINQMACMDYEYMQIIRRLKMYGLSPTGSKSADKVRLHEIELREAKKENCVTSKFKTITKGEQEKIQNQKKEKMAQTEQKSNPELMQGQTLLGKQIMLAINIKKKLS